MRTDELAVFEDEPLRERSSDLLSRDDYAGRVAELVLQVSTDPTSTVFGIVGSWGSGKTTLLNFVRDRLSADERLRVVEFNPWMLADLPTLVTDFFATLLAELAGNKRRRVRKALVPYVRAAVPVAGVVGVTGIDASKAVKFVADRLDARVSLNKQKQRVETTLKKLDQPILVVLDDIDRLQPDEILMVFKLVRLVGRLPNVYYLLAYDEKTVLDVIKQTGLAAGDPDRARRYLEKMVQVRLDVPPMRDTARRSFLERLLGEVSRTHPFDLNPLDRRWASLYDRHLCRALSEPRQIKRYIAQIQAHYPLVHTEVDFFDFATVTYLRLSYPTVVELLPAYKAELTKTDHRMSAQKRSTDISRWRERLVTVGVAEAEIDRVLDLLARLYPPITEMIGRTGDAGYARAGNQRAGSAEYFDRYLHLGLGPDDISDTVVKMAFGEALEQGPGPAWSHMVDVLSTNPTPVILKLRRLVRDEDYGAEKLLPVLCDLATNIPPDVEIFDFAEDFYKSLVAELLLEVSPASVQDFIQELARRSNVRFVADQTVRAQEALAQEGRTPTAGFNNLCHAVANLVVDELNTQAAVHPRDTDGVLSLLIDWVSLNPSAPRNQWLEDQLGNHGAWDAADFAALLVPIRQMSGGSRRATSLGDFNFELLKETIGIDRLTHLIGDPTTDPVYQVDEPTPEDTTHEARRARALQALAHRNLRVLPDDTQS